MSFRTLLLAVTAIAATQISVYAEDFKLDSHYVGEDKPNNHVWKSVGSPGKLVCQAWDDKATKDTKSCVVKYASPTERAMFLVTVKNGKLMQAGALMDSTPKKMSDPTSYIFVESPDGKFYASPINPIGVIHHSTFLAGGPVKTAGEIKVVQGVLTSINNSSGHYKPSAQSTTEALDDLKKLGVDIKKVKVADVVKGSQN